METQGGEGISALWMTVRRDQHHSLSQTSHNISSCVSKTALRCYLPSPLPPSRPLPILAPCHGSSKNAVGIDCTLHLLQKSQTGSPVESCRTLKKRSRWGARGPFALFWQVWGEFGIIAWHRFGLVEAKCKQHVPAASSVSANSSCQKPGIRLMKESPCTIKGIYWEAFINIAPCLLAYSLHVWMPRGAQWGRRRR